MHGFLYPILIRYANLLPARQDGATILYQPAILWWITSDIWYAQPDYRSVQLSRFQATSIVLIVELNGWNGIMGMYRNVRRMISHDTNKVVLILWSNYFMEIAATS